MALVSLTKVRTPRTPGRPPAWSTSVSRSAARSGWRFSAPSRGARWLRSLRSQAAAAAGHPLTAATQTQIQHRALATGFSHGFLVSAAISLLALIIALAAIRVTREDLSGVDPLAASAD